MGGADLPGEIGIHRVASPVKCYPDLLDFNY